MKNSKQARRNGKALFRSCLVEDRLDEAKVRAVVRKVLEQKPRGCFAVLSYFLRLVKAETQRRTAVVESPTALPADLRIQISEKLERIYGTGLSVEFLENAALMGGLRVQVGSDVYDGSLRSRLNQLAAAFAAD